MVSGSNSKADGGTHILSAGVREILESIKEVVGNHSDADIYVALKETNMDPNETAQKLLNQDPFHEVKRRRDRKKENHGYRSSTAPENGSYSEHGTQEMRVNTHVNRNIRRGSYSRTALPDAGLTREFRVVRDNRVSQNGNSSIKPVQTSTSAEPVVLNTSAQSSSKGTSVKKLSTGSHSSQAPNRNSQYTHSNEAKLSGTNGQGLTGEIQASVSQSASQMRGVKPNGSRPHSMTSSSNSVIGVYSSFSDPVHVPSLDSRPAAKVGAIKREVGVVGARRQSAETFAKPSSSQSRSISNLHMEQARQDGGNSKGSLRPLSSNSRSDQSAVSDSPKSSLPVGRSFSGNQHINRQHQPVGHQKTVQWKPKLNQKSSVNDPGVIGKSSQALTDKSEDLEKEGSQLQDKMSRLNISDNVIIAEHIRVSETDRFRLTFGSFGAELKSAKDLDEESQTESSRLSVLVSEPSTDEIGSKQLDLADDRVQNPGLTSPGSGVILDQKLADNRESSSPEDLGNYSDVGLVQDNGASYTPPESQQQQDASNLSSFSTYDPQTGYDIPYFRPAVDEALHGQGAQEALSSHVANSMPASTIPMVQQVQQHQPIAQMYPQVHVSHFANLMPYRHVFSPVYVPPMAMPGYSSNPAYPHPPNGSNYLLMPGGGSHLSANGLKYGIQQFKSVPTGSASGFGNFTSPTGYAINTPGVIGSATGLEDSSRMKYKDGNLYVPNPQAETSEMWMNPRDISSLQSGSYYSMSGQTPHATYLPSHSGHASFNAAAAAAQSSHMQYPGLYHPQPTAMANPHHLGSAMAGNVGMAAAAPGAQVGAYQQPQLGHMNWTGNF
ncbi:PREDICTED: uncharacterized protein LOC109227409 isoform X1 [Nicotiana attenuata]|uniref:Gbf-interacting protein 1 n=1 Tax=Nicotiana attenuata TaxID=49451 RepID=A0A1J6IEG2_NICAT|nr:PREDICTED: uncharacterized protein LOC109227409 isoform X1 [Nicotiana attenuata]OIT02780.1 gbf-interacting protein 1 [Nicotiana attenuata]